MLVNIPYMDMGIEMPKPSERTPELKPLQSGGDLNHQNRKLKQNLIKHDKLGQLNQLNPHPQLFSKFLDSNSSYATSPPRNRSGAKALKVNCLRASMDWFKGHV